MAIGWRLALPGLLWLAAPAWAWVQLPRDREAVESVWTYIDAKDCPGAVRALNDGIAKAYPSVLLMAGSMFESGVCLKANWDRAADFYQRAESAGHPSAAARLAAGYAAPIAGPDKAAAIWWAMRARLPMPTECATASPWIHDADRFVAALRTWPEGLVDACAYVAGVVGSITGDIEFSKRAASFGMKGDLTVVIEPARDSVVVQTNEIEFITLPGVTSGAMMLDRQSKTVKREFELDVLAAGERAFKRYAKPARVDPTWKLTHRLTFNYVSSP
jgi:hypothetical protein